MSHKKDWACRECQYEVDENDRLGFGMSTRNALCSARFERDAARADFAKLNAEVDKAWDVLDLNRLENASLPEAIACEFDRQSNLQARFDRLRSDFERVTAWHVKAIHTIRRLNRDIERWTSIASAAQQSSDDERCRLRTENEILKHQLSCAESVAEDERRWAARWKEKARMYRRSFNYAVELAADRVFEKAYERAAAKAKP